MNKASDPIVNTIQFRELATGGGRGGRTVSELLKNG